MSLATRFWDWVTGRAAVTEEAIVGGLYPYRGQPPKRGTRELLASYKTAPWLRAATDRIAAPVAANTWRLYAKTGSSGRAVRSSLLATGDRRARREALGYERAKGTLREIEDHPLLDLLARPNPSLTGRAARHVTQVHLDIKGESFWILSRNADGMPVQAWPIPPHWVLETPSILEPRFRVGINGKALEVPERDMLWMRHTDPENPYARGTGVAESLGDEIETDHFAAAHLKAWFYNRATPDLLVALEGATPSQVKEARQLWEENTRGTKNAYRAHFHNGKMNAMRLDSSFRDQQMVEIRKLQRDFLVQVFAIPPECVGILTNSNRATITAAFAMLAEGVICPRLEFWRTELQHNLVPQFDDRLILEYDSPVPEDREYTLEAAKAAPWSLSQNEWRALADHGPVDGGDDVFMAVPGATQLPSASEDDEEAPEEKPPESDDAETDSRSLMRDPPWVRALPGA